MDLTESNFRKIETISHSSRPSFGLIFACLGCVFGSAFPAGHNLGVINAPQKVVRTWTISVLREEYGITLTLEQEVFLWGVIVSVLIAGAAFASALGSTVAENIGRCYGLLLAHAMGLISGLIIMSCHYCNYVELLVGGRLLAGLSAGLSTSLVPLYLSEVAPRSMRGVMGVIFPLGLCFAILVSQVLGSSHLLGNAEDWPFLVGGHSFYAALGLILFPFMPKSPTYLLMVKNNPMEAHKELLSLHKGDAMVVEEEERVLAVAMLNKSIRGSRRGPYWGRSLLCVIFLNAGQQLIGINAVFFYSTLVFENAGLSASESVDAAIGAGVANIIMAATALPLIRYCRRKILLVISLSLFIICLFLLVIGLSFVDTYPWAAWLAFAALFCAVLTYGSGMGPVPYMIGTEIFISDDRDLGLSVGASSNWIGNLIVGLCFPTVEKAIGHLSFVIFIAVAICLLLFIIFYVPETYGCSDDGCSTTHVKKVEPEIDSQSTILYTPSISSDSDKSRGKWP